MATVYPLFFGFLFIVVCGIVGVGDGVVAANHNSPHRTTDPRTRIVEIASAEIGVREATGRNDGARVEEYLRYTGLGAGHEWCAAFVSWCYGQAGLTQPRNPWSPALFPQARRYNVGERTILPADLFAIYGTAAKRINHVGIVARQEGNYIRTIEGNSNNRVECRRRHVRTVYAFANWMFSIEQ